MHHFVKVILGQEEGSFTQGYYTLIQSTFHRIFLFKINFFFSYKSLHSKYSFNVHMEHSTGETTDRANIPSPQI